MGRLGSRGAALVGAAAVLVGTLSGCAQFSAGGRIGGIQDVAAQQALAQGMADAFRPNLTVNPPNGASGVSPSELVTAAVAGGQLTQATLRTQDGSTLDGALSPDGQRWTSSNPLKPNTSYVLTTVVRATSGQESTSDTKFTTLAPGQQVAAKINPADGGALNPASPLTVDFDKPIGDRGAVERALVIAAVPAVEGTSRWRTDRELVWQPTTGWKPGSQVTATLNFFGKQVGPGLFGGGDVRSMFHVGDLASPMPADSVDADLPSDLDPNSPNFAAAPGNPGLAARAAPGAPPGPSNLAGAVPPARPPASGPANARAARPGGAHPGAARPNSHSPDTASPDATVPDTTPEDDASDPSNDDSSDPAPRRKPTPTKKPTTPTLPVL